MAFNQMYPPEAVSAKMYSGIHIIPSGWMQSFRSPTDFDHYSMLYSPEDLTSPETLIEKQAQLALDRYNNPSLDNLFTEDLILMYMETKYRDYPRETVEKFAQDYDPIITSVRYNLI